MRHTKKKKNLAPYERPLKNKRKLVCGFPCKGAHYKFEQTSKGCKRTCSNCGESITETANTETTPIVNPPQGYAIARS